MRREKMHSPSDSRPSTITEENRQFVIEWLRDRSAFHSWFSSLIAGSFVVITVFGRKPDFTSPNGWVLSVAVVLFLFALLCNFVCVWSIPSWKYRVSTGIVTDSRVLRREIGITAWLGVIAFVCGLTLAVVGNSAKAQPPSME
jgi:ABC-type Fe3+ transport system permease subunit